MARTSKRKIREGMTRAKENEALWALVAVIAMVVFMEVYAAWVG